MFQYYGIGGEYTVPDGQISLNPEYISLGTDFPLHQAYSVHSMPVQITD